MVGSIKGKVALTGQSKLVIAAGGKVEGEIVAKSISIDGEANGKIDASGGLVSFGENAICTGSSQYTLGHRRALASANALSRGPRSRNRQQPPGAADQALSHGAPGMVVRLQRTRWPARGHGDEPGAFGAVQGTRSRAYLRDVLARLPTQLSSQP